MDASTDMPGGQAVRALLATSPAPLTAWYGNPLAPATARTLLARAADRQQACLRAGASGLQARLLMLIAHDHLGSEPELGYDDLIAVAAGRHERALLELVQGQLLATRKLAGALAHLAEGFRLAAPLLETPDYFMLVRRHELLAGLRYNTTATEPATLAALLNEAAVMNRLRSGERFVDTFERRDTVG